LWFRSRAVSHSKGRYVAIPVILGARPRFPGKNNKEVIRQDSITWTNCRT
jgi:hypothetical protein